MSGPGSLGERLRALPSFAPPPGGWARLEARRRARHRRYAMAGGGLALAASVLAAIGVVALRPDLAPPAAASRAVARAPAARQEVAQLISRSQSLERALSTARPQVAVWSSSREARATLLRQQLRVIDAQLNVADSDSAERQLWRERVKVMNALVDLHQTEAPALQYASYQY